MSDLPNGFVTAVDLSNIPVNPEQYWHDPVYYDTSNVQAILNENNIIITGALHLYGEFNAQKTFYEDTLGVPLAKKVWIEGNDLLVEHMCNHDNYGQCTHYHATLMDYDDVDINIYTIDTLAETKQIDLSPCDVWYVGITCNTNALMGASKNIQYAKAIFIHVNYDLDGVCFYDLEKLDAMMEKLGFKRVLLNKLHAMYIRSA